MYQVPLRHLIRIQLSNKVLVSQPLADHVDYNIRHLVGGIQIADVVTTTELIDITSQMLIAHFVVGSVVSPLQQ